MKEKEQQLFNEWRCEREYSSFIADGVQQPLKITFVLKEANWIKVGVASWVVRIFGFIIMWFNEKCNHLFTFLLWTDALAMTALFVAALFSASWKACIAFSANGSLKVCLFSEKTKRWFVGVFATTTKSKNKVECGILLDGVILECVAIFKLLACEDQSLLIWWDTFLVLDFCLDIFDSVCWFDFECDVLACECFNEDLH